MAVAWIGLGSMGAPMALGLALRGFKLRGFARRPGEHGAIRNAGGLVTDDLIEAIDGADVVCVNLFSEAQIDEVLIGSGAIAAITAGAALVVHSTVSPDFMRRLGDLRPDLSVVDAGFSGSPQDALDGRLTLMVGGEAAAIDRLRPLFSAYAADPIIHAGPLGAGMALKVVNNLMFAAQVAIARDGLRILAANGIAAEVALEALRRGSASSRALEIVGRGDPETMMAALRPYLDKDVPIARAGAGEGALGTLDAATRQFAC